MKLFKKIAIGVGIVGAILGGSAIANSATLQGFQGGTGISTSSTSTVGQFLQVASTSPFLTYQFATPSSTGGGVTTTINGVQGPTFTVTILPTSTGANAWTVTTSSASLFLNLLQYTSGTSINVSSNGVINFVNPGFLTNASITALSPLVWSSTSTLSCPTCLTTASGYSTSTGANPTAKVGINTVNGSANTFMRSDASPSLDATAAFGFTGLATGTVNGQWNVNTLNVSSTATLKGALTQSGGSVALASTSITGTLSATGVSSLNGISNNGNETTTNLTATTGLKLQFVTSSILATDSNGNVIATTTSASGNPLTTGSTPTITGGATVTIATSTTYSSFGTTSTLVIPAGITNITIHATGGSGGCTGGALETDGGGGSVTGTLPVTPGEVLYIYVANACAPQETTQGGWGIGGDLSWVGSSPVFSTSTVFIVAGGGGGGSASSQNGGFGGGTTAGSGGNGGGGGSQTAGGTGSGGGSNGSAGLGGEGAGANGGGGGNGYFGGGGGGGSSSGGGGGSSFFAPTLTATSSATGTAVFEGSASGTVVINIGTSTVTGPIIVGTNYAGKVVAVGTMSTTTTSFASPNQFVNGVSCGDKPNNATNSDWISYNGTSSFSITFANSFSAGQSYNYWCLGY